MNVAEASCDECHKDRAALERLLAAVLAVADAGIVVFDERGRFVMANPSFLSLFRWRNGGLHSETFASLFPDAQLPSSMIRLARSVSAGRYRTRIRAGDGSLVSVEVHARWITHEDEDSYWLAALTPLAKTEVSVGSKLQSADDGPSVSGAAGFGRAVLERIRNSQLGPHVLAGQIEVTNLDPIRQAAGEHWPQVATHIFAEIEATLARNLTAADAFTHDGSGGFTVCFGNATLNEAEQCAEYIEQDIRDRFADRFGMATAPVARSNIDRVILLQEERAAPDIGALIVAKLAEKRARVEKASSMTLAQVIDAATLDPREVISRSGLPTPLWVAAMDRTTRRAVQKIAAVSSSPAVVTNQIDHLLLGLTATRIYESLSKTAPPAFIVPVSFATFTNRQLTHRYLGLCRNLAAGVVRHLMFELIDVPADVASMRIEEIVASLRPFSSRQCLRLAGLERGVMKLWKRHFAHFTVRYQDIELGKRDPETLRTAMDTLHQHRCRLCVWDVPDQTTARTLADAGVDFVSGDGLVPWGRHGAV